MMSPPPRDPRRALDRPAVGSKEGGSSYERGALMPRGWRDRAEPRHYFREGSGSSAAGTAAAPNHLGPTARSRDGHQVRLFSEAPCQHFSFSLTEYWAPPSERHPTGNFSPSMGSRQVPRSVRNALSLSPGVRPSARETRGGKRGASVLWYRGGLVFEAHRCLYHSDKGSRTFQDLYRE